MMLKSLFLPPLKIFVSKLLIISFHSNFVKIETSVITQELAWQIFKQIVPVISYFTIGIQLKQEQKL